jgi:hypothetical protein
VILLKVDAHSVATLKLECDAPRAVDVDRVPLPAFECVEVKARHPQIIKPRRIVQSVKPSQASRMKGLLDLGRRALIEQFLQAPVLEAFDYDCL